MQCYRTSECQRRLRWHNMHNMEFSLLMHPIFHAVAMTRPKRSLTVIGDSETVKRLVFFLSSSQSPFNYYSLGSHHLLLVPRDWFCDGTRLATAPLCTACVWLWCQDQQHPWFATSLLQICMFVWARSRFDLICRT